MVQKAEKKVILTIWAVAILFTVINCGIWVTTVGVNVERLDAGYVGVKQALFVTGYALAEYQHEHHGLRPKSIAELQNFMRQHKFRNAIVEIRKKDVAYMSFQYNPYAQGDSPIIVYYQSFPRKRLFWLDAEGNVFVTTGGNWPTKRLDYPGIKLIFKASKSSSPK